MIIELRLGSSKTRRLCPSEAKPARFLASLSSPFGRGTMPAQPSNGFFTTQPELYYSAMNKVAIDFIDFD
jgi:hypothetical protein